MRLATLNRHRFRPALRVEELEGRINPATFTLFDTGVAPDADTATFDTSAVELGVQFEVQQTGTINAIQFFRGVAIDSGYSAHLWDEAGNLIASGVVIEGQGPASGWQTVQFAAVTVQRSGTIDAIQFYRDVAIDSGYTVHLWNEAGDLLASGVVIEGQGPTPGWQTVQFGAIRVDPGQTYTASYFASEGGYSYTHFYYSGPVDTGPLVVPADGGVYAYGGGFPDQAFQGSNYWVTPRFTPYPPPVITGLSQSSGPLAGMNLIRIFGANFDVPDFRNIYFGDQISPAHNFISPTELLVQVPPGVDIGTVNIRIEALGGTSHDTPADDYTYLSSEGFFGP